MKAKAKKADARSLKMESEDKRLLSKACETAFADIAERYYLDPLGEPEVHVGSTEVKITIHFEKQR